MKKALIVIDVQNDFVDGGTLAVPGGLDVVPVINGLILRFCLAVATQDWHPRDHGSFASQHAGKIPFERTMLHGLDQTLWPDHCVEDTSGAAFVPDLRHDAFARVFRKGIDPSVDSYSGFFDNARRHSTGLTDYLREHGVTDVYLAGLATDYCVKFTALDARQQGFAVWLIIDGCRGVGIAQDDVARAVDEMVAAGVKIINSGEVG